MTAKFHTASEYNRSFYIIILVKTADITLHKLLLQWMDILCILKVNAFFRLKTKVQIVIIKFLQKYTFFLCNQIQLNFLLVRSYYITYNAIREIYNY